MKLLREHLPELTEEFLCQIVIYATVVYECFAQESYTKNMKRELMSGDLKKVYPQQG